MPEFKVYFSTGDIVYYIVHSLTRYVLIPLEIIDDTNGLYLAHSSYNDDILFVFTLKEFNLTIFKDESLALNILNELNAED